MIGNMAVVPEDRGIVGIQGGHQRLPGKGFPVELDILHQFPFQVFPFRHLMNAPDIKKIILVLINQP
jgi:hypothetical protein